MSNVPKSIAAPARVRERVNRGVRHAIGLTQDPPPICTDADEAYFPVDGVARVVHGDLASMLVGGLGSLFFQMLHPLAMAGVAQHSRYQDDPRGRLLQTANFIGTTTYGSRGAAWAAIERVRAVHEAVRGVADDGRPYDANDPHLLAWIHACEASMFLAAYRRFGRRTLSDGDADAYVAEMAHRARDLGAESPPTTVDELHAQILAFRPELRLSADGVTARDFIARGVLDERGRRAYRLLVRSAFALLPPWGRELLGVENRPVRDVLVVRPLTRILCAGLRLAVPPAPVTA